MEAARSNLARDILVCSMAGWVGELAPWKVVAHHTFVWEASLWSAKRCYERFMKGALPGVSYFYAIEQNPGRPGYHIHALWDSLDAPRKATHRAWLERYGRNRIEPIRGHSDVVDYCAKYVCKEGAWWDVRLSFRRFNAARRSSGSPMRGAVLQGRTESVPLEPAGGNLFDGVIDGKSSPNANTASYSLGACAVIARDVVRT